MNKIIPFLLVRSSGPGNLALGVFWDLFGVKVVSVDGWYGIGGSYKLDCYDY